MMSLVPGPEFRKLRFQMIADKIIQKRGEEPLRQALYHMSGVDLTGIDAIGVGAVQVVLSEYGPDLSRFPTEKQFVSHVTLAPNRPITGGKPMRKKKKRDSASSRVAAVLRTAATSVRHSHTALGAYYRQIARRIGADVAVFATARQLATLIYRALRWGQPYVDEGAEAYEKRYREAPPHQPQGQGCGHGLPTCPQTRDSIAVIGGRAKEVSG